jgi:MFS family permease
MDNQALLGLVDDDRESSEDSFEEDRVTNNIEASGIKKRYITAAMLYVGLFNVYAMRVNLSEAVEPMQEKFKWTDKTQGYVLSSFFWGYILGQIPGGYLATKIGGKRVFGLGVLSTGVLTLLLPLCANAAPPNAPPVALYCLRALMGVCESVTFPATLVMFTSWFPAKERSFLVAFVNSGAYMGTAIAFPVSGFFINMHSGEDGISTSWPLVFYSFGSMAIAWWLLWCYTVYDTPEEHPTISHAERVYLQATTKQDADVNIAKIDIPMSASPPWRGFVTCPAAWALYINHFATNFGVYTLMTYLPKFMKEELDFDMKKAGFIAVLPYLLMFCTASFSGWIADKIIVRYTVLTARLGLQIFAFTFAGGFLIITGFVHSRTIATVTVSASIAFSGFVGGAYSCNYLDLSPHYAGIFFSVGNTFANIAGILAPIVAGQLLGDDPDSGTNKTQDRRVEWQHVFYVSTGVYAAAIAVWVVLAKGKPLPELN